MNDCPVKTGLEKAYSSHVRFERRESGDVVVKSIGAQARWGELNFHKIMKAHGLPAMNAVIDGEELILDFIANAQTLGDCEIPENFKKFGQAVRAMHKISFSAPSYFDENGARTEITWNQFIKQTIDFGLGKQRKRGGFNEEESAQIMTALENHKFAEPKIISLLHGDLHPNNVMFAGDRTILFDTADWIAGGDKLYDLALIALDATPENLLGFIKGYGEDFTQNQNELNAYMLLRAFERWPNPFETQIPKVVERILNSEF
ncbi:hypothetical protein CO057_01950 [Candidatus Uhrbacteria bacterium CG_4_9_14_0_2_um_filter_41_50]|uniref:Aminoglycoside phosphotransferase domain-containing protein n=1 Tax=Candidatus Uhrbacteria bacterium CG_4_9_14_0_2_um_filter_41_50 TaxID=1975031 RepID=A0A2M8EPJ3_9BACT|nr:MAG: hypothetical protein COZ45_04485 [Candidatus Uhrbacteria bacterium CG_4_10_14_3_um_filter_41_21]PIZ54358.1 MAG: hypothetical protein COY24_04020 [Candidatus Uhrbacteria bacterium CG_4_10_14_0_2_um_filter_41_21]PJB84944.1 MAG: hypothetical protein CO086_00880 [Candidatus Uhrbacteria bacterium CG_4_9_14_0_8_um_filter_41_16]PJC24611.1 MAG: hypothetical protein CO057_01950 [Candidatus Uhrbacteria bacterium CG_4_9_14_0_2_um_filter_41_50]PJE74771.1 MAG: hypothetical protein COV03_03715 [Candi